MNEPKPESRNTVQFFLGKKYYDINITDQMLQKLYLATYIQGFDFLSFCTIFIDKYQKVINIDKNDKNW